MNVIFIKYINNYNKWCFANNIALPKTDSDVKLDFGRTDFPWEDPIPERKAESDPRELVKTLFGFANSVRPVRHVREEQGKDNCGGANPETPLRGAY